MKQKSHKRLTEFVYDMLAETVSYFPLAGAKTKVARQAHDTDSEKDLEFVDVEGGIGSGGRDNPHKTEVFAINDVARYVDDRLEIVFGSHNVTSFNHFIDIRKGKAAAKFDDFDGYSYRHGSASKHQYEETAGVGVDEGITYWYNDEYVHVEGRKWYRGCSPSVSRYSFYRDKSIYGSSTEEGKARFPLADSVGGKNKGIPYSVFMPVDNMARFWYWNYLNNSDHDPKDLGYVMHAIQDASIPHHAAGCSGNWHRQYEEKVRKRLAGWLGDPTFQADVKKLFEEWKELDPAPPNGLNIGDQLLRSPHMNWAIEWMVTWMALNAYHAYVHSHQNFAKGWTDNKSSMRELTKKAAAMSMLALYEASLLERAHNFVPDKLQVKSQMGQWCVGVPLVRVPGVITPIARFSTQNEADLCLKIIQRYGMNSRCAVGLTPYHLAHLTRSYYLTDGKAPSNPTALSGEQIEHFDPNEIEVTKRMGGPKGIRWIITQGTKDIIDFQTSQGDAMRMYHAIQKYGFTCYGWLGARNNPSMQYFLLDKIAGYGKIPSEPLGPHP